MQPASRQGNVGYPHTGKELQPGLHMVPVRSQTLPPATCTNAYILGTDELILIDPGASTPEDQQRLTVYLNKLEAEGATVVEIWLTHQHIDHIGGLEAMLEAFAVPVAAHPLTAEALPQSLRVDRDILDGDCTRLQQAAAPPAKWRALHTPGHARGHLCFYERSTGAIITGDMVLGVGTVLVAPPEGDMVDYMASLCRLRALPLRTIYPGHGPPVDAIAKLDEYIAHRQAREAAILEAVQLPQSPAEIVRTVYVDVSPMAYPLAELNVLAHLHKLEKEGRVRQRGGKYQA